jgi:hypothetical protein
MSPNKTHHSKKDINPYPGFEMVNQEYIQQFLKAMPKREMDLEALTKIILPYIIFTSDMGSPQINKIKWLEDLFTPEFRLLFPHPYLPTIQTTKEQPAHRQGIESMKKTRLTGTSTLSHPVVTNIPMSRKTHIRSLQQSLNPA